LAFNGTAVIAAVAYNKDGVLEPDPYLLSPPEYSYSQKPSLYMEDQEYRYVLTCSFDKTRNMQDNITLNLGDCSDICILR
jgi:hypothetical protein